MSVTWTPRMQQVSDAIVALHREHGRRPKLTEIAQRIGVTSERVRQIVQRIGTYRSQPRDSDEFRRRRLTIRYAKLVLPIIEDAALAASKRNRLRAVRDLIEPTVFD